MAQEVLWTRICSLFHGGGAGQEQDQGKYLTQPGKKVLTQPPPKPADHPTQPEEIWEDAGEFGQRMREEWLCNSNLAWQRPPCVTAFSLTCTITIAAQPLQLLILSAVWMALSFPPVDYKCLYKFLESAELLFHSWITGWGSKLRDAHSNDQICS